MQNDIELLELAAKAAGIGYEYASSEGCAILDARGNWTRWWNPLRDDGDALRLAVKLGILTDPDGIIYPYATTQSRSGETISGPHRNDPCAATRRAIVRAAAEIGKML